MPGGWGLGLFLASLHSVRETRLKKARNTPEQPETPLPGAPDQPTPPVLLLVRSVTCRDVSLWVLTAWPGTSRHGHSIEVKPRFTVNPVWGLKSNYPRRLSSGVCWCGRHRAGRLSLTPEGGELRLWPPRSPEGSTGVVTEGWPQRLPWGGEWICKTFSAPEPFLDLDCLPT